MALQYFAAICKRKTKLSSTSKLRNIFSACSNLLNVEFEFFLYRLSTKIYVVSKEPTQKRRGFKIFGDVPGKTKYKVGP